MLGALLVGTVVLRDEVALLTFMLAEALWV